jgi:hypothetical protein
VRRRPVVVAALVLLAFAGAIAVFAWTGSNGKRHSSKSATQSGADFSARFAGFKPASEPNGKLSKVVWPNFVLQAGPEVKHLYEFQITHGQLMRYMPCFCGCGKNAGHRSNRDCYVRQVNPDGSVVLESMAPT